MWAEPGDNYFGPLRASASDRGLTVAIRAEVERIVWDMGNGDKVTCTRPRHRVRPQRPARRAPRSPDCGYHSGYTGPTRTRSEPPRTGR